MSLLAVIAATLFLGQDAAGDCRFPTWTDRCEAEKQARARVLLGAAAIEEEAAADAEVYRAFHINGSGRDMPAVSFERRDGDPPKVVVLGRDGRRLEGPVSADTWAAVVDGSISADRAFVPLEIVDAEFWVCIHPWTATVEMANSWYEFGPVAVRRRTVNTCDMSPTAEFAGLLASLAAKSLPSCAVLDTALGGNRTRLLETCLVLEGDTMAAASLLNQIHEVPEENTQDGWRAWLGHGNLHTRVDWTGEVVQEGGAIRQEDVAAFLARRFAAADGYFFDLLSFDQVSASTSRDAVIDGRIQMTVDDREVEAPYRQVWRRDGGFDWQLVDWTIEAFRPGSVQLD